MVLPMVPRNALSLPAFKRPLRCLCDGG